MYLIVKAIGHSTPSIGVSITCIDFYLRVVKKKIRNARVNVKFLYAEDFILTPRKTLSVCYYAIKL